MARTAIEPTGIECPFDERELIITKTDLKGRITYANDVFLRISKYSQQQVIGAPHSLIRHPDMPRCIFKLLWDTVRSKKGLFAHILNMASDGDHYWTFAHVTATLDAQQNIIGFHSNRRKPNPAEVGKAKVLYAALRAEENLHDNSKEGMLRSCNLLMANLKDKNRPEASKLNSTQRGRKESLVDGGCPT
jgi:PAS domain S-box-containing protein